MERHRHRYERRVASGLEVDGRKSSVVVKRVVQPHLATLLIAYEQLRYRPVEERPAILGSYVT